MGRLGDFSQYLYGRRRVAQDIEDRLCALQAKYETYFAELCRVRESEVAQLTEHTLSDRSALPEWFNTALDSAQAEVEQELSDKISALREERDQALAEAESKRRRSVSRERATRSRNVQLDAEEEQLKERNAALLASIADFNARIRELGRGFGFFASFFSMRTLAAQRRELDGEQADVAARIEALRARWVEVDREHASREGKLQDEWVELRDRAASLSAKIDALEEARPGLVTRSTIERVLAQRSTEPVEAAEGDPACPRCGTANPAANRFCAICAQRLHDDRLDFEGSIAEIAEVNFHHRRFSEGMRSCQEIIGLVRGIKSGIEAFTKSVEDVRSSEDEYPLPKLEIDVPPASVAYGGNLDSFAESIGHDWSLHPKVFADRFGSYVDEVFTGDAIQEYFETMGEELSKQAEAQW